MYLEIISLLLRFIPTVVASLKIQQRLILKKLLPLPARFQHFRFRVRFRFQPLSSNWFRFHKKLTASTQARSQKFAMGGAVWGFWGWSPQPPEANGGLGEKPPAAGGWGFGGKAPSRRRHGGLGAEPPAPEKFAFFCKNNFILGLFWLKNNPFKLWLTNWQCKQD